MYVINNNNFILEFKLYVKLNIDNKIINLINNTNFNAINYIMSVLL